MAAVSAGYLNKISSEEERPWNAVKNGYAKFTNGDVLIAKITPCFQNRKSAIANNLISGIGCGSSEFHILRSNESVVDRKYLFLFAKSSWFISYGVENFKGTAGQQRLGTLELKNCRFPLPPILEQQRIVEKVKRLFEQIDRAEKAYKELSGPLSARFRQLCLEKAIHGKLVPQLEREPEANIVREEPKDIPFNAPKKWKWVKFTNVATLLNGRAYSKSELLREAPGRVPVLRVGNFFTNGSWYYSDLKLEPNKYCDNNDLLFAWSASFGPKIWNGGRCIYHYHIWKVLCSEYVDKEWLYFWLLSMVDKLKNTSGRGSTMIHITKKETEQTPLALPPIEEQRRIVRTIKSLFRYCDDFMSI